jgi:hypothetical protein
MGTYDRLSTLKATGRNMAAADSYSLIDHNWTKVHPDYAARRIIEASYLSEVFARSGEAGLARQACELGDRAARKYGFV